MNKYIRLNTKMSNDVLNVPTDVLSQSTVVVVAHPSSGTSLQKDEKVKTEKKEKKKSRKRELSSDMMCSICQECMVLPVTLVCGHNYCKNCIEHWIETNIKPKCPLCKCVLGASSVVLKKIGVNKVLDGIITQQMGTNEEYSKRLKKVVSVKELVLIELMYH